MRKSNRVYTEDTYNGEAPVVDTPEGKALLEKNPELAEDLSRLNENKTEANSKQSR